MVVQRKLDVIGSVFTRDIVEDDGSDSDVRCPNCGCNAGEKDETHSRIAVAYFTCASCSYFWQEVSDIEDWREIR